LFKAIGGRHFSFMVFGGTQVLMDLEPAYRIWQNAPVLHGPTHTLAGAFAIGTLGTLTGKPVSEFVLRRSGLPHLPISWLASAVAGYVGAFSHVLLDALMHADMRPFWPLSEANPLLGAISLGMLHGGCALAGVVGAALCWFLRRRRG
jgi:membrane-bound metal-dependent hydrolase YbcI (DUF457 family)